MNESGGGGAATQKCFNKKSIMIYNVVIKENLSS